MIRYVCGSSPTDAPIGSPDPIADLSFAVEHPDPDTIEYGGPDVAMIKARSVGVVSGSHGQLDRLPNSPRQSCSWAISTPVEEPG